MDELITTKQVQDLLQIDRITVYRMLKDGRLRGVKVGNQWRFHRNEIEELISGGTRPKQNGPTLIFDPQEVLPVHCIQVIQDVFAEMNGIGSVTTGVDGIPVTEVSNSCEFCNLILGSPSGRQACIESWKALAQSPKGDPKFTTCHAGFLYARGRIELKEQLTAIQVAGQILISEPDPASLDERVQELSRTHGIPLEDLKEAAKSIRVIEAERQQQIAEWLKKVAVTFQVIAHERAELLGRLKNIADLSNFEL